MNLDALGNIGDFLGGVGVAVTLIYLAIQVRQNTTQLRKNDDAARVEAAGSAFDGFSRFRAHVIDRPDVADLYYRGSRDRGSLDPVERLRFALLAQELFFILANAFERSSVVGTTGLRKRLGVDEILRAPGFAAWWAAEKGRFEPDFIAFLDGDVPSGQRHP